MGCFVFLVHFTVYQYICAVGGLVISSFSRYTQWSVPIGRQKECDEMEAADGVANVARDP